MKPMNALVMDGDQRPALAIVRSLGRRGVSVMVGEERSESLASASKYCRRHVTYPSPYRHPEAFAHFLSDFVAREGVDVVIPVSDVTTHCVSLQHASLQRHTAAAVPSFDAFDLVTDKWRLLQSAAACGIPVPRTHFVDGVGSLKEIVPHVEYPAVIKPSRSRVLTDRGWESTSVRYAGSEAELWRLYDETEHLAVHPSLIQARVVGPGVGTFVLFADGELLTAFGHRRLREKPPSGGVSVLRESVAVDPQLEDHAVRLLGPLGWHGVAMLEYKQDQRTGTPFLMEVNGRFWGSLQLALDAGMDFPSLLYDLARGRRPGPTRYKVGVKSRWLLGDLDHVLARLFHRDRDLHLPATAPSRLRTLIDFLTFSGADLHYEITSRDDPRPFWYELRQYTKTLAAAATRGLRSVARAGHLADGVAR
jgi:predicted ATP-grasp superfamily ATP-dependent carboligase